MKYHSENFNGVLDFRSNFHKSWCVEMHLHEYSEILYCKTGEGSILINGQDIKLCAGQFVWIPPNYVHQLNFPEAEVICAVFSNDFIPLYFSIAGERRLIPSPIFARELSESLEGLYLLRKENQLKVSGTLNIIAQKVVEESGFEETVLMDGVLFQKVVTYISTHYTEEIRLSVLAKMFGYNEKYLSHALHSLTGIHFSKLLSFYRIEHAKELLKANTEKSIMTIALESGFSATNTFHRAFLSSVGMTPLQFRRAFREDKKRAKKKISEI